MLAWNRLRRACVLACITFAASLQTGCSKQADPTPPKTAPPLTFEAVRQQDAAAIQHPAATPEGLAVRDRLLSCAVKEAIVRAEPAPEDALIAKFADDDPGLFLASLRLELLAKEDPAKAADAARELRSRHPENAVGALAFDWELRLLKAESAERFLAACDDALGGANSAGRIGAVALQRRWEYYQELDDVKKASLDALLFWARFPERTVRLNLMLRFTGVMEQAGFLLEAKLLTASTKPGDVAEWLWEQSFIACAASDTESADVQYYKTAPAYTEILATAKDSGLAEPQRALACARCACLAASSRDEKTACAAIDTYARVVGHMAPSLTSTADAEVLLLTGGILAEPLQTAARQAEPLAKDVKFKTRTGARGALDDLGQAQRALLAYCIETEAPPEAAAHWVTEAVAFFDKSLDNASPSKLFEQYLAKYTQGPAVAEILFKYGDFQKEKLKSPQKAIEQYRKAWEIAPKTDPGAAALLAAAQTLYEQKSNEEAYLAFQEVMAASAPNTPRRQTAQFGAACTEAALGMEDDAMQHMLALATDAPQAELAPAALYWVAKKHVERHQYEDGQRILQDMQQRYPNAPETVHAKNLITKLDELLKSKI